MKLSAEGKWGEKSQGTWKEQQASDDLCRVRQKARARVCHVHRAGLQMSQLCCNTCLRDDTFTSRDMPPWRDEALRQCRQQVVQCGTPGRGQRSSFPLEIRTPPPQAQESDRLQRNSTFSAVLCSQNDAISLTLDDWLISQQFRVLKHWSLLSWYLLKWDCLQFFQLLLARGMCHGGEAIGPLYWAGFLHLPPGRQACQARIFTLWFILPALYLEEEYGNIQIKLFNQNPIKWHHWYKN